MTDLRIPATLVLTVLQCLAASHLIGKSPNTLAVVCGIVAFLAPPAVAWLFMAEMNEQDRRHRARLGID